MKQAKLFIASFIAMAIVILSGCQNLEEVAIQSDRQEPVENVPQSRATGDLPFLKGADLSYINELQDIGVKYYSNGTELDPYKTIKSYGANLVRVRLWHNPTWTNYSTLADVKKSISRAKNEGLYVLLDFHYSDTWTDPEQNLIPAAWRPVAGNITALSDSVYNYTFQTLTHLRNSNLLPEMVQIGNETNKSIMVLDNSEMEPVNFVRNTALFNAGLQAVQDFNNANGKNIKTVLHIAMNPNDVIYWVSNHKNCGLKNFDMLGVSYYPQWQDYTPQQLGELASKLVSMFGVQLFVAETGHIWTRAWNDNNMNLMSKMCLGYPEVPCPQLQKDFIIEVKEALRANGGAGYSAWEPFWVSANNQTLWGVGSNWENVAFFDFNNNLHTHGGMEAYSEDNVKVTFEVNMWYSGNGPGYITGDFTDDGFGNWQIIPMKQAGEGSSIYYFDTYLKRGQEGRYFFLSDSDWDSQELINNWKQDRTYQISTSSNWMKYAKVFGEE